MKSEDIFKAIGEVDENIIANAKKNQKSRKKLFITVGTLAACAVFGCIGAVMLNMPKNNISESSVNSTENSNNVIWDGDYSACGESKIITGHYSVIENTVPEKSGEQFETSVTSETSEESITGDWDYKFDMDDRLKVYYVHDGDITEKTFEIPELSTENLIEDIFQTWKDENNIGDEVKFVDVSFTDDGYTTVSEFSGEKIATYHKGEHNVCTLTVTKNLENYYSQTDKELLLKSLQMTILDIYRQKMPDEYCLVLVDEIPTEESESNQIDQNDIQYNDQGEILE